MSQPVSMEVQTAGALPIPDLSHLWTEEVEEVGQEEVDQGEVEEPVQEQPVSTSRRSREKAEEEDKYKNPHARIRILEREKREEKKRAAELTERLAKIESLLEQKWSTKAADEQEEVEEIDEERDPLGATLANTKRLAKELEEIKKSASEKERIELESKTIRSVDRSIQRELESSDEFKGAIKHIAKNMKRIIERQHPDLEDDERLEVLDIGMKKMKLDIATKGLSPVDFLLDMAEDMGYEYDEAEAPTEGTRKPSKASIDATKVRDSIREKRDRTEAAAGLGGTPGRAAGKLGIGSLLKRDGEDGAADLNWKLRALVKEGALRPGDTPSRLPKVSDILRAKARQT